MKRLPLLRKFVQAAALLGFTAVFIAARGRPLSPLEGASPDTWLQNLLRLDPFAMLANLLASHGAGGTGGADGIGNVGRSIAAPLLPRILLPILTLAFTLVLGRAWCGWICPLGTVLDWLTPSLPSPILWGWTRAGWGSRGGLRAIKYLLLLSSLALALGGSLALLIFDPLTIFFRTLGLSLWPALDWIVTALEKFLFRLPFPWLQSAVVGFDGLTRPALLPYQPVVSPQAWLFAAVFVLIVALNWLAPRFWCRYLCPLGGLLALLSKFALLRRETGPGCTIHRSGKGCGLCSAACPTGTIDAKRDYRSDPAECTLCMDCLPACPRSATAFRLLSPRAAWRKPELLPYDPSRRQALITLGASAVALLILRLPPLAPWLRPRLIRPPGAGKLTEDTHSPGQGRRADEENHAGKSINEGQGILNGREKGAEGISPLLDRCIRCGACLRACPTSALQPASLPSDGVETLWTPVLVPRLGYCDYSCTACGQVCPVGAIPALSLVEKRRQILGLAHIDQERCLPWAQERPCIVCEEMCPLPEKAIELEIVSIPGLDNPLQRPRVIPERCIGCGICEYKCPLEGEAAIQIHPA